MNFAENRATIFVDMFTYGTNERVAGKTTVSVLHDVQLLLDKQQRIWDGDGVCIL